MICYSNDLRLHVGLYVYIMMMGNNKKIQPLLKLDVDSDRPSLQLTLIPMMIQMITFKRYSCRYSNYKIAKDCESFISKRLGVAEC